MAGRKLNKAEVDRLTITLAPGQRRSLEKIARNNNATLAYVTRYALGRFIEEHRDRQLELHFPSLPPDVST